MTLTIEALRQEYDHYQRKSDTEPSAESFRHEHFMYHFWHEFESGALSYSELDANNADDAIQEMLEIIKEHGYPFEWKLYDYDTPQDLGERLAKYGFSADEVEAVMVLPIADAPAQLLEAPQVDIRKVTTPEMFRQLDEVYYEIWKDDPFSDATPNKMSEWLLPRHETAPDSLSIYLVYVDDIPVSYGRVEFAPDNPFASIWGGSTLPAYRRRGIYTQLVAVRLQEAKARGCKYLQVDARMDTSMPILAKLGFLHIGTATAYNWSPDAK